MKKQLTSIIIIFKQQTLSSLQQIPQRPELTTISYNHIVSLQLKNWIYVPQYLLAYLCLYANLYSMLITLSKLTTEQKTRKIGYRDAITYYVPDNNLS